MDSTRRVEGKPTHQFVDQTTMLEKIVSLETTVETLEAKVNSLQKRVDEDVDKRIR